MSKNVKNVLRCSVENHLQKERTQGPVQQQKSQIKKP